jgi:hypothetical protein
MIDPNNMTGQGMCEFIVEVMKKHDPTYNKDPKEIWETNRDGILSRIFELFYMALTLEGYSMQRDKDSNVTWVTPTEDIS